MNAKILLLASLLLAVNGVSADEKPDLDDPKVLEKVLKEALSHEAVEIRGLDEEEFVYQAGKQEPYTGWWKTHPSGKLQMLTRLKDGKSEGLTVEWHENGQKKGETTFKDGKAEGQSIAWHENGRKKGESTFKNGELHGPCILYWDDGTVDLKLTYKDGVEVKE